MERKKSVKEGVGGEMLVAPKVCATAMGHLQGGSRFALACAYLL